MSKKYNKQQKEYLFSSNMHSMASRFSGTATGISILGTVFGCISGSLPIILFNVPLAVINGRIAYKDIRNNILLSKKLNAIEGKPEKYPLEHAKSIIIDDKTGLEALLERTSKREKLEWGTAFKVSENKGDAVIDYILPSEEAERNGIIKKRNRHSLSPNYNAIKDMGFNGFHHYHPNHNALSYQVSKQDRNARYTNWISLITFNVSGNPEIIGFNTRYSYLPESRSAPKSKLVRVLHEDIIKYLS